LLRQTAVLDQPQGRKTDPAPLSRPDDDGRPAAQPGPRGGYKLPAELRDGKLGFRTFGEFALTVRTACQDGGQLDRRLEQLAPTTFGSEASGSDGGFLIPPDFRAAVMAKVMGEESLISRTDQLVTTSNRLTVPLDETEPWGTSGIRAYWTGEGALKTPSKPAFQDKSLKLDKLAALVVVTDELIEDATALDTYLRRKTPQVIDYKINEAIVRGTGVGMPLGILNSAALVTVTKESGQAADTVVFANLVKMWGRLTAASRRNAVWLTNQDVETALLQTYITAGSNGFPTYLPPGGISQAPYGTLFGRPILPLENMGALGDKGDIVLADLTQYVTLTKSEKLRTDVSIHLYFDYDMTAYRFVMRVGGQPWWNAPVTRANGSNTLSPFVTLEERAEG
jgi:HK97 family phage major capsid protein